jgi:hypothetical protein
MTVSNISERKYELLTVEVAAERAIAEFGDEAADYAAMCANYCFICGYTPDAIVWSQAAELIKRAAYRSGSSIN